ncbi:YbgC/FadM family acyl-CoA thioesterase [Rudanella paleaurantiibacter]|uniref:YbgC/FadM family acyl-CoA thioesterase n=1 Tax=Rudanella paleaurantiibacter TaxID=2614655 RepID=A0A7J5U7C9_9BACT|nr:thioesterase family protein [Rudanella paleaurantiibacter]KAB7733060.1 YbgC/FadM family acyl-CoA thioesterase [Rudanella paleaurantiibacter]
MFTFLVSDIRVRYADTDQMGYVYYGNYARFYEIGRVEALRSLGFHYKEMEESGVMMPVYENHSRYLQPARYDDLLSVTVTIPSLPKARIVFQYAIRNEAGLLLNTGETTLVFQRRDTGRLCAAPEPLLQALKPFFSESV